MKPCFPKNNILQISKLNLFILSLSSNKSFPASYSKPKKINNTISSHLCLNFHMLFFSSTNCCTASIISQLGSIHDISSSSSRLEAQPNNIFLLHFIHLSVIFTWVAGNFFHIASQGNFSLWYLSPVSTLTISHTTYDPHFSLQASAIGASGNSDVSSTPSFSGLYNILLTVGFTTEYDIFLFVLGLIFLVLFFSCLSVLHATLANSLLFILANTKNSRTFLAEINAIWVFLQEFRLSYHLSALLGTSSVIWSLHIIFVVLPVSRGCVFCININSFVSLNWSFLASNLDSPTHLFGSASNATSLLTFLGSLNSSDALFLTDIAHHHLALGVLLIWSAHIYSTLNRALGSKIRDLLYTSGSATIVFKNFTVSSLDLELSIALLSLGQVTLVVAQHMYSLPSYVFLSSDYVTNVCLFTHHIWIGSLLMIGSFVHGTLFLVRDFEGKRASTDFVSRLLATKAPLLAHLSWVTLWLGFHTLLVYCHNDSVTALGSSDLQILITPILAQVVQSVSGNPSYGFYLISFNLNLSQAFLSISNIDLLIHHALSLGIHTTVLILLKGSLDCRGTAIVPDKTSMGFSFPCDGPGRGGTCDISAWDIFYLAFFWLLNTVS